MLSEKTVHIVKSTAPVLDQHGETLTRHFYERMFSRNPEVRPFFNPANQRAGSQQRALAAAICAFAANIDNLEVLGSAVELIAQKHASLQVKAEHYSVVGENLLASIQDVLGDAATSDIIDAWAEAYGFLANILIGRERQIYREHASARGGWEGFKAFRVMRKVPESANIASLYLAPADGAPLPAHKPGQYVTVRFPTPDGSTTMRNYSLSDVPGKPWYRISVKREPAQAQGAPTGFVSALIHDRIEVGDTVEVAPPCGEFVLDTSEHHQRPLVLLAAGVGITPILSMLLAALQAMPQRQIVFIHGSLNPQVQAFRQTIDELAGRHSNLRVHYRYSEGIAPRPTSANEAVSSGIIDAELVESLVPGRDADYFFCGPAPFMISIYRDLLAWGIPASQVHFEFFGPKQELSAAA